MGTYDGPEFHWSPVSVAVTVLLAAAGVATWVYDALVFVETFRGQR